MFNRIEEWKSNADIACMLTRSRGLKPIWITHFLYFVYLDIKDLFKKEAKKMTNENGNQMGKGKGCC